MDFGSIFSEDVSKVDAPRLVVGGLVVNDDETDDGEVTFSMGKNGVETLS